MIYVFVFIVSLFFFKIALKFKNKQKYLFILFSGLGLFVPSFLAGIRDISMGTDVKVYILPLFIGAGNYSSFSQFVLYKQSSISDILYLLLTYVCRLISNDYFLLFFMITFISMIIIYIALLIDNNNKEQTNQKSNSNIMLGLIIYFLFMYNSTFNMARQSIAIAFVILAFALLRKRKKILCYILIIISSLFHNTSLAIIPFILLYNYIRDKGELYKKNNLLEIVCIVLTILLVIFTPIILDNLSNIGFLSNALKFYTTWGNIHEFNFSNTLFYIVIFLIVDTCSERLKKSINDYNFYRLISILSIILLQLGAAVKFMDRITFYIFYPLIFLIIPKLSFNKYMNKKEFVLSLFIYFLFVAYWIYWIVFLGYHGTYPFVFR